MNNQRSEREIKETTPFVTASKRIRYLGINLPMGLPGYLRGQESACDAEDRRCAGLIPGLGRSPGEGHGNPLQCSRLESPMDRGACQSTVHRVVQNWTPLKRLTTHKPT